jgi:hypothetical protein
MTPQHPQNAFAKTVAALVAVLALGLLFAAQYVSATDVAPGAAGPAAQSAEYFPAQFTIKPAADESAEPIPTF